jgi:hypothetical protein
MDIPNDEAKEEYEMFMVVVGAYAKQSKGLLYASRTIPIMRWLQ